MTSQAPGAVTDGSSAATRRLDPSQHRAATAGGKVQLVLAGPGSGKTTTLAARFIHLVRQGVDRRRILALTFTRKAADEMAARIASALGLASPAELNVATFHGFAFRHLRRNPAQAGLPERFQLWDTPQQRHVFSARQMWWNEETDILDIIAGAKERLLDAKAFAAEIDKDDEVLGRAVEFFRVYETALRKAGAIDFTDMVPFLVRAMERDPAYAGGITGAFDHLLVDEYQDINPAQIELVDRFVAAGLGLWAVGDDDQTLYAFRAADVRFILGFPDKHRGAEIHVIDRNYRSAKRIVTVSQRLIEHNRARRRKDLKPVSQDLGEVVIRGYWNSEIEARQVARAVAALLRRGHAPHDIAILYRTGAVGLAVQPALQALQIPYEVRGSGDIWQSVAARLLVGSLFYLRDGASPEALSRMGSGRRAEIAREKLDQATTADRRDFQAACRFVRDTIAAAVPSRASDRDRAEWGAVVDAVVALASSCGSLDALTARIAEQSGTQRKTSENAVVLSTIHSAKGLEWAAVFLIGMEQGVLPHANNDDVEEERRVAYVGITRAKRMVGLTYANKRFGFPSGPSRFLDELVGKERRDCAWTGTDARDAHERLPLLSDHERQLLLHGPLPPVQPPTQPQRRGETRPTTRKRKATAAEKEQARVERNRAESRPPRQGVAWSDDEDKRLRAAFDGGRPIAAIAAAHERTRGAITSRLMRLGLITEDGVVRG